MTRRRFAPVRPWRWGDRDPTPPEEPGPGEETPEEREGRLEHEAQQAEKERQAYNLERWRDLHLGLK